jgi:hypothetical protein
MTTLSGDSADRNVPGVVGTNNAPGIGNDPTTAGRGVVGNSASGIGVLGQSDSGDAVFGNSRTGTGVAGNSTFGDAVHGNSGSPNAAGVSGFNVKADQAPAGPGVFGHSSWGSGVVGDSDHFDGVWGVSHAPTHAGVSGHNLDPSGKPNPLGLAGFFEPNVVVNGTVTAHDVVLSQSDCAEDFDMAGSLKAEPGTVMVIDRDGALRPSQEAYDKKVAGVVSGGGDFKPGIVLGRQASDTQRMPIALVGKVYCKVDACYSPIKIGDLLTTSQTPGHAMKVTDPLKALGSVIGKALRGLEQGQGLIPILVALQ